MVVDVHNYSFARGGGEFFYRAQSDPTPIQRPAVNIGNLDANRGISIEIYKSTTGV